MALPSTVDNVVWWSRGDGAGRLVGGLRRESWSCRSQTAVAGQLKLCTLNPLVGYLIVALYRFGEGFALRAWFNNMHDPDFRWLEPTTSSAPISTLAPFNTTLIDSNGIVLAAEFECADFDGDGDDDIVVFQTAQSGRAGMADLCIYENSDGRGIFTAPQCVLRDILAIQKWYADSVAAADIDRDGYADLVYVYTANHRPGDRTSVLIMTARHRPTTA